MHRTEAAPLRTGQPSSGTTPGTPSRDPLAADATDRPRPPQPSPINRAAGHERRKGRSCFPGRRPSPNRQPCRTRRQNQRIR
jgi:hypothetical protein